MLMVIVVGTAGTLVLGHTISAVTEAVKTIVVPAGDKRYLNPTPNDDNAVVTDATPESTVVATHTYPDWSKKEPINILLIGLDLRTLEEDTRADTQIVVHIDPKNKTASMISIPRDLWVNIPGYGMDRVNSAYQKGDSAERNTPGSDPGQGALLAMSTIESDFGIPIDYYASVDFGGFEKVVDTLGGVTVDVPRPLVDNDYPLAANSYGSTRIYIPAGLQHMDGHIALEYARSRHEDSDIGRNSRQQQVLLALRRQGMSLGTLFHIDDLTAALQGSIRTSLDLEQIGSLAQLAPQINSNNITTCQIDATMSTETILANGADVLIPNWSLVHAKIQQCFSDPQLAKEAARISVKNGTLTAGMGTQVKTALATKGLSVVDLSSVTDQGKHPLTTVIDYSGGQKPRTLQVLKDTLSLQDSQVQQGNPDDAPLATQGDGKPVDIVVIAGDDRINLKPVP